MTQQSRRLIDEAFAAARFLPEPAQEALAAEIMARIGELDDLVMSEAQRAGVRQRLAAAPVYADADDVRNFFVRHGAKE